MKWKSYRASGILGQEVHDSLSMNGLNIHIRRFSLCVRLEQPNASNNSDEYSEFSFLSIVPLRVRCMKLDIFLLKSAPKEVILVPEMIPKNFGAKSTTEVDIPVLLCVIFRYS